MDFITLREFRTRPAEVWEKLAKEHKLVVTRNGKPFALLTETSPQKLEDDLRALRRAKTEMAVIAMQKQAEEKGLDSMALEDIDTEIQSARQEARKRAPGD